MTSNSISKIVFNDLTSGLVVFLVALPLCLGVALASNAPLFSGILAGIIGGLVVGFISGSSTSVSGPAAGLTAVVASQIGILGSYEAFLTAVVIAGILQVILSACKMGFIAAFFPSSVIKGLLWAIGIILVLKQIPHLLGHDADPVGDETFLQPDDQNTFSELVQTIFKFHYGAAVIGLFSLALMVLWDKIEWLKKTKIPAPIVVILISILIGIFFDALGEGWSLFPSHLVQVPVASTFRDSLNFLMFPDLNILSESTVYVAAITIALVASLETLLNLEALDKIDPLLRNSPPNRELFAQGIGNLFAGLVGALPVTSVIVRSSVNINSGVQTKLSTIWHGFLILISVLLIPNWLNAIPLSALAAILVVTGFKLASPKILMQMWQEGKNQFLPFILTIAAIVFTDLLIGILIGLGIAICFILHSNIKRPIKKIMEKHAAGDEVLHIELPNQVSFFNRASLEATLKGIPPGGHVLIDANSTDYVDPDILDLINDFQSTSEAHKVSVSLVGFKDKYPQLEDRIQYVDFTGPELQANMTPERVLEILREGNLRFREGIHLTRDLDRQLGNATTGQFPMAVVLSCIDSRAPVELIFDLSLGDIFSVRIAGNVVSRKILGSIEYSCAVAGAKLVLVMGHTSCGAVRASVDFLCKKKTAAELTGCVNLDSLVTEIQKSIKPKECADFHKWSSQRKDTYLNDLSYLNVLQTMRMIRQNSSTLDELVRQGKIAIMGAIYDISTAEVSFFQLPDSRSQYHSDLEKKMLPKSSLMKLLSKMFK